MAPDISHICHWHYQVLRYFVSNCLFNVIKNVGCNKYFFISNKFQFVRAQICDKKCSQGDLDFGFQSILCWLAQIITCGPGSYLQTKEVLVKSSRMCFFPPLLFAFNKKIEKIKALVLLDFATVDS